MLTVLIPHCVLQVFGTLCSVDRCVSSGLIRQENNFVGAYVRCCFCPGDSWQARASLLGNHSDLDLAGCQQGFREQPLWPITTSFASLHVCRLFSLAGNFVDFF
jgi:hypothetical protein